jgi:hypothetical protein
MLILQSGAIETDFFLLRKAMISAVVPLQFGL